MAGHFVKFLDDISWSYFLRAQFLHDGGDLAGVGWVVAVARRKAAWAR